MILLLPVITQAAPPSPVPAPVFLKAGFSSILEFDERPTEVVLGDSSAFQVERLNMSVIIRPLVNAASTNLFVYFRKHAARLFILTAADEVQPSYHQSFSLDLPRATNAKAPSPKTPRAQARLWAKGSFTPKKDFFTVTIELTASQSAALQPDWASIQIEHSGKTIKPKKVWAERNRVARDSTVEARLTFERPDLPSNLTLVSLIVPMNDGSPALKANLSGGKR